MKDFFSKCDQIRRFLQCSNILHKSNKQDRIISQLNTDTKTKIE